MTSCKPVSFSRRNLLHGVRKNVSIYVCILITLFVLLSKNKRPDLAAIVWYIHLYGPKSESKSLDRSFKWKNWVLKANTWNTIAFWNAPRCILISSCLMSPSSRPCSYKKRMKLKAGYSSKMSVTSYQFTRRYIQSLFLKFCMGNY
jgi:hypothetical protein